MSLKKEILELLKRDEEFRYAVAGLIGLEEILKRLDRHEELIAKILERLDRHEELIAKILERLDRHEELLERHERELVRLREDMNAGFRRHDEILERHSEELKRLREDMMKGFELVERRISALGARWGIESEEAFREGLRGILEKELGLKVRRWTAFDREGIVYGYPSGVEVDIAVEDEEVILIEVTSHAKKSDLVELRRKAELYERLSGRKVSRLLIVTPYAEERALEASKDLGVEIYTKV